MSVIGSTNRGVTLIELLIAVVFLVVGMVMLSLLFPKATKAIVVNRQRLAASQLAQNLMQANKKFSYDLIAVTNGTALNFPLGNSNTPGQCNCTDANFSSADLITGATILNGVTYTQAICTSYMNTSLQSLCPSAVTSAATDPGLKRILVRVTWLQGTDTVTFSMDSLIAPL